MDNVEHWKNFKGEEFKIVNGKLQLDNLNIEGDIYLQGCTSLKYLPDNLSVGGYLDLNGCTSLVSLADNLTVGGGLDLEGCTSLKSLPDNLNIEGFIDLNGCTSLVSLPDNLTVGGYVNLNGCTSLKHIGKNNLFEKVCFDEYFISQEQRYSYIHIFQDIPESLKQSFIGKRVIDLIDDPRIYGTRYAEAIITGLDNDGDFEIEI